MMRYNDYMLPEAGKDNLLPRNIYAYHKVADVSQDKYVSLLAQIHKEKNLGVLPVFDGVYSGASFSIVGGYCRNYMLGTQTVTDVDVVTNEPTTVRSILTKYFNMVSEGALACEFVIPGNTLHLLGKSYTVQIDDTYHVFVDPTAFDFTINLGAISCVDGQLYAPPITVFDIKHKIIRPCLNSFDLYGPNSIMLLGTALRAIRFSLKYDMSIHSSMLRAIDVLFALQNQTHTMDDVTAFHTLKHIDKEPEEFKARYYEVLKSLRLLDTDKYSSFGDYFKYITDCKDHAPRPSPVVVQNLHDSY